MNPSTWDAGTYTHLGLNVAPATMATIDTCNPFANGGAASKTSAATHDGFSLIWVAVRAQMAAMLFQAAFVRLRLGAGME